MSRASGAVPLPLPLSWPSTAPSDAVLPGRPGSKKQACSNNTAQRAAPFARTGQA